MALSYVFGGNFLLPRKKDEVHIGCHHKVTSPSNFEPHLWGLTAYVLNPKVSGLQGMFLKPNLLKSALPQCYFATQKYACTVHVFK